MSIVCAGRPFVLHLPRDSKANALEVTGDVLGIFNNVFFEELDIQVSEGDRFFVYSDRYVKGTGQGKQCSPHLEGLFDVCSQVKEIPIDESAKTLMHLMQNTDVRPRDDIVILGIEV